MIKHILAAALAAFGLPASAETMGEIFVAQMKLNTLGYTVGNPDGQMGPNTRRGLEGAADKFGFDPTLLDLFKFFAVDTITGESAVTDDELMQVIKNAVGENLKDPFSAQYRNIRSLPSGRICGEVNAKNAYGAFVGWTPFMTYRRPVKVGEKYLTPSIMIDDESSDIASMACLIDA